MKKNLHVFLAVGVILTFLPPLIGLVLTVVSMAAAFHDLSGNGISNPTQLAGHIGGVLNYTAAGLILSFIGLILLAGVGLTYWEESRRKKIVPKRDEL